MLQKKYYDGVEILSINKKELIKKLKKIVYKIKEEIKDVKDIILFGSYVKDSFLPSSDVDLVIILKESDKNFIERQDDFVDYFLELGVDVNIIVYTEKEWNKLKKGKNLFIKEILKGEKI